ncbi:hypothetical protein [Pengzhenrongella sp.]|jgi:hypothetical protein|uniref:hypothetical protein n=1 Tax=Pengzhenrongella sp. TaxID=2888820 RepID=UPI002F9451AC
MIHTDTTQLSTPATATPIAAGREASLRPAVAEATKANTGATVACASGSSTAARTA